MKAIYYSITKLGKEFNYNDNFFVFFPEEIVILENMFQPCSINHLKNVVNKVEQDRFKRKLPNHRISYDFVKNKVKSLIDRGFMEIKK